MLPNFNGNPNNQLRNNGTNMAPQQVMGNPGNFCPNPMQIRPQFPMGVLNPQLAMPPFTNPSTFFAPTQLFPFPQGNIQNFNCSSLNPMFAHNAVNPHQLLPNGQFNVPNLVQNVNQLLQMQLAGCGPQNFANVRPSMVNANGNLQQLMNGNVSKQMHSNDSVANDFGAPQLQQNLRMFSPGAAKVHNNDNVTKDFSAPQQQNLHGFSPPAAKLQSNAGGFNGTNNNWKRSNNKNLIGNFKNDASQRGFVKQQFHHKQNSKGNFKFHNENQGKGCKNGAKNFIRSDSDNQIQVGKGRPLMLNYTEQEIQHWREQRKKNYPSKANIEKKLKDNSPRPEDTDAVAKIRRQQLKEILEKQAELGCEVAEIPSCYLSDSELQTDVRVKGQNIFGKRERFQNNFNKRGKFHRNDQAPTRHRPAHDSANFRDRNNCIAKKQRLASDSTHMDSKREPSLLQKLLHSDIERDQKHLLQVFRFMAMNSFFEEWPSKSLKFPAVVVKESGGESGSLDKKYDVAEGDISASAGSHFIIKSEGKSLQEEGEISV